VSLSRTWGCLRYKLNLASVVLCLLAALAAAIPEIRVPIGIPIENTLSEGERGESDNLPLRILLAQTDEREEGSDRGWHFVLELCSQPPLPGTPVRLLLKSFRFYGSHYPTGPPTFVA
jgi:hypothetical protein